MLLNIKSFFKYSIYIGHSASNSLFLSSWFLAKYKTKEKVYLENNITENKLFKKNFSNFPFTNLSENNNFDNITKILYQELWFNEDTQENKKLKNTYILKA